MRWLNNCGRLQQRARRGRASAVPGRARPCHRAAVLLEPRSPPTGRRGLGAAAHRQGPVRRQRHRLPRQRGLPPAADRLLAAVVRVDAPQHHPAGRCPTSTGPARRPSLPVTSSGCTSALGAPTSCGRRRCPAASTGPEVRGAFTVGDQLWTAMADGSLVRQTFDGETLGAAVEARPWDDPVWSGAADRLRRERDVPGSGVQPCRRAPGRHGPDVLRRAALLHAQRQHRTARALVQRRERHRGRPVDRRPRRGRARRPRPGCSSRGRRSTWPATAGHSPGGRCSARRSGPTSTVVGGPGVDGVDWSGAVLFSGVGPAVP